MTSMSPFTNRVRALMLLGLFCFMAIPAMNSAATEAAGDTRTLWEIGNADGDTAEFALGRDGYARFNETFAGEPLFIVGRSDEKRDWPYVHPGPTDAWAGSRQHTFKVLFNLGGEAPEGRCTLHVDLVDTHDSVAPKLRIEVNGRSFGFHELPRGGPDETIFGDPSQGKPHSFEVGFPANALKKGQNELTITNIYGSWMLYDALRLEGPAAVALEPGPATMVQDWTYPSLLVRKKGELHRMLHVGVIHHGEADHALVRVNDGERQKIPLKRGPNVLELAVPASDERSSVSASVIVGDLLFGHHVDRLPPVRQWTLYFVHHTHLDIGYTHVQDEVLDMQMQYLRQSAGEGRRTADYPPGTRFKWNPEGLWAVDALMLDGSTEDKETLRAAVRDGTIGLDALYGNVLTGLCRPEELMELGIFGQWFAGVTGADIDSAMISDVPGYTWGLVPALAHCGVKYLSIGPNPGHRIGYTLSAWGDKPFYWVSPSGKHRILCWMSGKGYAWFHGAQPGAAAVKYVGLESRINPDKVLDYLEQLDRKSYPYDMVQIRYNIGADNGPPDMDLSDFVREWNERYAYPRIVVTTTSDMFHAFEEKYGDELPVVRGDFTPYWEDGAASSAAETGIVRDAAERLVQAGVIQSLLHPAGFEADVYRQAWRNVLLYNEHTWGSWNSISEPEADFTVSQWKKKQSFAHEAERISKKLLDKATETFREDGKGFEAVLVFNTCSWPRTDLVVLPEDWNILGRPGDRISDPYGNPVPSQVLASGELAFVACDVPPLGYACYTLHRGKAEPAGAAKASDKELSNGLLTVTLDPLSGAVSGLERTGIQHGFVNRAPASGLNDFIRVEGRSPTKRNRNSLPKIKVVDAGPLVATVAIDSDAPGCDDLRRTVRLVDGLDYVSLSTAFHKQKVYDKEAIHLAFPFAVENPEVRVDTAWAVVRPDRDLIRGACRNHFCAQRWVDVSNADHGVTLFTRDAPLVEIGGIHADPIEVGWRKKSRPSSLIYSYIMNNYWETNYRASQEGYARFRYAVRPHGGYDAGEAARFGIERGQELIAVPSGPVDPPRRSFLRLSTDDVVVTSIKPSMDGEALMIRLFNAGGRDEKVAIHWNDPAPAKVWMSSPLEENVSPLVGALPMAPWEIVTLRVEF